MYPLNDRHVGTKDLCGGAHEMEVGKVATTTSEIHDGTVHRNHLGTRAAHDGTVH